MTLHRTPVHHYALENVRDGRIRWQVGRTAGGGWFTYANGQLADQSMLVALGEMWRERLIGRRGPDVVLTETGATRLAEWDAIRAAVQP